MNIKKVKLINSIEEILDDIQAKMLANYINKLMTSYNKGTITKQEFIDLIKEIKLDEYKIYNS